VHGEDSPCLCLLKEDRSFLHREKLPYSRAGLLMEKSSGYVKISIRLVLTFLWNEEDSALVRTFTYSPPSSYAGLKQTLAISHSSSHNYRPPEPSTVSHNSPSPPRTPTLFLDPQKFPHRFHKISVTYDFCSLPQPT
jgi:hypothetical protein